MNPFKVAALWARLMAELGYERFAAQGGDWGSAISTALGLDHAQRIIGIHLNYIAGRFLLGGTLNQIRTTRLPNPTSQNSVPGGTLRAAIAMFKVRSRKL
jgi:pimeloyl-ACP methyl ester carboxylesterase